VLKLMVVAWQVPQVLKQGLMVVAWQVQQVLKQGLVVALPSDQRQ
jgi:hypothetical protein